MKKVLIVTYYWIPSGGSGVQRWVKMVKYLRNFGIEPVVYAPENPEYPSTDYSLSKDIANDIIIIKRPIWEPYNFYRMLTGKKNEPIKAGFISEKTKKGLKDKISVWIRGNLLIPDPRVFWIRPSVKFLSKYMIENAIDTVITTGPPHSMHLIGRGLKKRNSQIKWIADFRDPWTKIYFYKDLNINPVSDLIHRKLEREILTEADAITVVGKGMKADFEAVTSKPVHIITNGFDNDDTVGGEIIPDKKFTISHIGLLTEKQNPVLLWETLNELCTEFEGFKDNLVIQLVGNIDFAVTESIQKSGLTDNLKLISYIAHDEALKLQKASRLLLLLLINLPETKHILTGKLFEYLNARRPILCVGHTDGDAAEVIQQAKAGFSVNFTEKEKMKEIVLNLYNLYLKDDLQVQTNSIEKFSRKWIAGEFTEILKSI